MSVMTSVFFMMLRFPSNLLICSNAAELPEIKGKAVVLSANGKILSLFSSHLPDVFF